VRIHRRGRAFVAATLAVATMLGATAAVASAATTKQKKSGGTLTYLVQVEGTSLDPAKLVYGAGSGPSSQMFAIFGSLLVENPQKDGAVEPLMAKSITTTDGGTTWVLKLKPDLKFTDGTPLDAAAVVYNWDRIKDPANRSRNATDIATFQSYTATDPTTVTIVLKDENTQLPHILVQAFSYIGSPTAIKANPADFGSNPVGAGPFKLDKWTRNSEMDLSRNTDWNASPGPYIDKLVIKPIPDTTQRQNTYNSGAAQAEWTFKTDDVKKSGPTGSNALALAQLSGSGIQFNTTVAPFDDVTVRQAFAMALNVPQITAAIYPGEPSPAKAGNKDWTLFRPSQSWYNGKAKFPATNLSKAQKLIDAYVEKTGNPISVKLSYVGADPTQQLLNQLIKSQIEKLEKVTVDLDGLDTATLVSNFTTGNFQMGSGALLGGWPDPPYYGFFHSGVGSNTMRYSNAQVDAALDASRTTTNRNEQLANYKKAQVQLAKDVPYLPTRWSTYYLVALKSVSNVKAFANAELRTDLVKLAG
jgi:peptide/nickel transport system substrate-binding protein